MTKMASPVYPRTCSVNIPSLARQHQQPRQTLRRSIHHLPFLIPPPLILPCRTPLRNTKTRATRNQTPRLVACASVAHVQRMQKRKRPGPPADKAQKRHAETDLPQSTLKNPRKCSPPSSHIGIPHPSHISTPIMLPHTLPRRSPPKEKVKKPEAKRPVNTHEEHHAAGYHRSGTPPRHV